MSKLARRYAAWSRAQAGTLNCGHLAGAAIAAAVIAVLGVTWVVHRYGRDIEQLLTVIGVAVLTLGGLAAACGAAWAGHGVWAWAARLRAASARRAAAAAAPRCDRCPPPAPAAAMAVRQGGLVTRLCTACWLAFAHGAYGPGDWTPPEVLASHPEPAPPGPRAPSWPDAPRMAGAMPTHEDRAGMDERSRRAEAEALEAQL